MELFFIIVFKVCPLNTYSLQSKNLQPYNPSNPSRIFLSAFSPTL
jgi:hypothetical protein